MSRQASRNTNPELVVRRRLHAAGYRYRLHFPVPGLRRRTIDIAFPGPKVAVFLDGCFWHVCPLHSSSPRANAAWWQQKLSRNQARDIETSEHLASLGWLVLRFWEHEPPTEVADRIALTVDKARGRRP
ncbi:very short patch repair endonuclease [Streptomyces sp. NPDC049577]|uniref:very short patch repair endonuclease n=1 Tax=Streptomyces sp. NPDC049577 TaxID=3155153 RepID=UPI00341EB32B